MTVYITNPRPSPWLMFPEAMKNLMKPLEEIAEKRAFQQDLATLRQYGQQGTQQPQEPVGTPGGLPDQMTVTGQAQQPQQQTQGLMGTIGAGIRNLMGMEQAQQTPAAAPSSYWDVLGQMKSKAGLNYAMRMMAQKQDMTTLVDPYGRPVGQYPGKVEQLKQERYPHVPGGSWVVDPNTGKWMQMPQAARPMSEYEAAKIPIEQQKATQQGQYQQGMLTVQQGRLAMDNEFKEWKKTNDGGTSPTGHTRELVSMANVLGLPRTKEAFDYLQQQYFQKGSSEERFLVGKANDYLKNDTIFQAAKPEDKQKMFQEAVGLFRQQLDSAKQASKGGAGGAAPGPFSGFKGPGYYRALDGKEVAVYNVDEYLKVFGR